MFKDRDAAANEKKVNAANVEELKAEKVIDVNEGIQSLLELKDAKDFATYNELMAWCCLQACDCCLQIR